MKKKHIILGILVLIILISAGIYHYFSLQWNKDIEAVKQFQTTVDYDIKSVNELVGELVGLKGEVDYTSFIPMDHYSWDVRAVNIEITRHDTLSNNILLQYMYNRSTGVIVLQAVSINDVALHSSNEWRPVFSKISEQKILE